jgi:hypothetical protein
MTLIKKITLVSTLIGAINFSSAESIGHYNRNLASDPDYRHAIQPSIGFDRGNPVFAADYEFRFTEHVGVGGSAYFTPDKKSKFYPRIFGIGADAKLHAPLGDIDMYLRPGVGFSFVSYKSPITSNNESSVIFSPILGVGAIYRIAQNFGLGFEYLSTFNWTDDEFPSSKHDFLIATQIRF